jgi:hypothetical protein
VKRSSRPSATGVSRGSGLSPYARWLVGWNPSRRNLANRDGNRRVIGNRFVFSSVIALSPSVSLHHELPIQLISSDALYNAIMLASGDESPMNFAPLSTLFLANFREHPTGEVRRIPLLGTSVNKGPSRGNGPRFNKGKPRPVRSRHIGFVPTLLAYLQGSIPLATGRSCAYNTSGGWPGVPGGWPGVPRSTQSKNTAGLKPGTTTLG